MSSSSSQQSKIRISTSELAELRISPDVFFRWLSGLIAVIIFAFVIAGMVRLGIILPRCVEGLCHNVFALFHLDLESSLPAWYSSILWLLASGAAVLIAAAQGMGRRYWQGLAVLFVFLSMDEAAMFHERIGGAFGAMFSVGDYLFYDWLLYGLVFTAAVGAIYLPFLFRLPSPTRRGLLLSGAVFVSGAIGVEIVGGAAYAGAIPWGTSKLFRAVELIAEEGLEMLGIALLIRTLLRHLAEHESAVLVRIRR